MCQRRQLELIKNNDWEILYHSGKANVVADALSKKERLKMIMSLGEFIRDFGNSSEGREPTNKYEINTEKDDKGIMRTFKSLSSQSSMEQADPAEARAWLKEIEESFEILND
ncbi:hypothetical protein AgCh_005490 [Apium graveolens]